ncbi:hypothetical protein GR268_47595, partial [Rhizobium leguminosarum]|nr:hypothetical protein [Rhizobium leguminosarum]
LILAQLLDLAAQLGVLLAQLVHLVGHHGDHPRRQVRRRLQVRWGLSLSRPLVTALLPSPPLLLDIVIIVFIVVFVFLIIAVVPV